MALVKKTGINFTRVFDILAYQREKYPNAKALSSRVDHQWKSYSIYQIQDRIDHVSAWLMAKELTKGDHVVLVPEAGSPEWMILDFACQQIGVISVILYPTLKATEVKRILSEVDTKICFCATTGLYDLYGTVSKEAGIPLEVFHLEENQDGYFTALTEFKLLETQLNIIQVVSREIEEDDLLCILYTSGSTGESKGVMLSHANVVFNIIAILSLVPLEYHFNTVSFLPFAHIFERVTCYAYMAFGVSVYFSQDRDHFSRDFKSVRPQGCTSVPRVLEKLHEFANLRAQKSSGLKKWVIQWAVDLGEKFDITTQQSPLYQVKLFIARLLVLNRWRRSLGGRMKYMIVGAAALRPEIGRFFTAGGIRIIEGYGMTEMSPLISINRFEPGMQRWGTVGLVIPGVELHLENINENGEGEIWVRGPNLMQGYFKKPALTQAVINQDGWLQTGDIGKLIESKYVQITDRIKDLFKTSAGKYIAPTPLQLHFTRSIYIERCLIIGFQRPFVTALVVPNFEMIETWCLQHDIHYTSAEYMVHNIKVKALYDQEITRLNEDLPGHERVRRYILCAQDWTLENDEMTSTFKPKRDLLIQHYQKAIEEMYGDYA